MLRALFSVAGFFVLIGVASLVLRRHAPPSPPPVTPQTAEHRAAPPPSKPDEAPVNQPASPPAPPKLPPAAATGEAHGSTKPQTPPAGVGDAARSAPAATPKSARIAVTASPSHAPSSAEDTKGFSIRFASDADFETAVHSGLAFVYVCAPYSTTLYQLAYERARGVVAQPVGACGPTASRRFNLQRIDRVTDSLRSALHQSGTLPADLTWYVSLTPAVISSIQQLLDENPRAAVFEVKGDGAITVFSKPPA